jgi:hypothetical protein
MKVVGKEAPRIDMEIPIQAEIRQPVQKIFPVLVRPEYGRPFNAPPHDVMQSPGSVQSWLSRHIRKIRSFPLVCQVVLEPTSPFRPLFPNLSSRNPYQNEAIGNQQKEAIVEGHFGGELFCFLKLTMFLF